MTEDYGKWLEPAFVRKLIPYAEAAKVSEVARSDRGFIPQYLPKGKAGLDRYWFNRRNGFVARHRAQLSRDDSRRLPSRRKLALAMWAYGNQEELTYLLLSYTPAEYARLVKVPSRRKAKVRK